MRRLYRENTWKDLAECEKKSCIVLMPLGATEQHGHHLPLGTDAMFTEEVARRIGEEIEPDIPLLMLPTLYLGLSVEHMQYPGTITLAADTYYHVLMDVGKSLAQHGFTKLLLLCGHGGNSGLAGTAMFTLRAECGMQVAMVDISRIITAEDRPVGTTTPEEEDSHGGEMETAMILAAQPGCVQMERAQITKPEKFMQNEVLRHTGPVGLGWLASDLAGAGSCGNPLHATAEQGNQMLNHITGIACAAIRELNQMPATVNPIA